MCMLLFILFIWLPLLVMIRHKRNSYLGNGIGFDPGGKDTASNTCCKKPESNKYTKQFYIKLGIVIEGET